MSDSRLEQLNHWLQSATNQNYYDIQPASADASFRRYFRATGETDKQSYIIMDAPPEKENCEPFIHITELIRGVQVNSPQIIARDLSQGFLLLSDLGTQPYLDVIKDDANALYSEAIDALIKMQSIQNNLPLYDALLLQNEMALFETWYLNKHLNVKLNNDEKNQLSDIFSLLINNSTEQPQVFVHRDYHSRNLMFLDNNKMGGNPGVIDFQDAVIGPITYDLVSLFKDCYIEWPRAKIEFWLDEYLSKTELDSIQHISRDTFIQWFDLMGIQRHLKVLGIFSRLNYRDNKEQYLDDLPLTLKYVVDACKMYPQLQSLNNILEQHVLSHPKVIAQ